MTVSTFPRCWVCWEALVFADGSWFCADCPAVSGSEGEAGPDHIKQEEGEA